MSEDTKPLTPSEKLFVEAYCTVSEFDEVKAYKEVYKSTSKAGPRSAALMRKPNVARAINERLNVKKATFKVREDDVIEGIYKEATNARARPSERIQAWVQLGKHLGMFREKVEPQEKQVTYNIINYNSPNKEIENATKRAIESISPKSIEDISDDTSY